MSQKKTKKSLGSDFKNQILNKNCFNFYATKIKIMNFCHKRKLKIFKTIQINKNLIFMTIGFLIGFSLATWIRSIFYPCNFSNGLKILSSSHESKKLVFIGVLTAQHFLDTRAKAIYETWGQTVPGKIQFFSRFNSTTRYSIPLVSVKNVNDSYPPLKKSFMMLKYMHDNYIDKFEWFMRAEDDVYIKSDSLEIFLRSLNSSKPHFIGHPLLDGEENLCMGGPGIVMSRVTLKLFVKHISLCLKNLYSSNEDVEIGRCVEKFANISCTLSNEVSKSFHF
jgi:hypothetical protein